MKKIKKIAAVIIAAALALSITACAKTNSAGNKKTDLTDITVCLDWTPNTNHTGMFAALEKGYYEEAGLNVTIIQPPENGATQACSAGQAQFAVDFQDILASAFTSDTPMNVTAVAALIQHNTSGIISAKGQGMESPAGLTGNTYLTWDSPIELAMMKNVVNNDGGNWDDVEIIPNTITNEAQDVKENPNHAIWAYYAWGGINAKTNNIDTDFFFFKDFNKVFDYYTPVLVANNDFLKNNPEQAKAFLEATGKGYKFAVENPEEAGNILIKSDDTGSLIGSEALVTESQKWLAGEYISDAEKWGYIDAERWDGFYKWLYDEKLIEKEIPAGFGFTNDYLA